MQTGDVITVLGCVGKEKYIAGRRLDEIERILGFHTGRLAGGMAVAALLDLPGTHQFEPAAYSNVAKHRFRTPQDLNIEKLKAEARDGWAIAGGNRLVKVLPAVGHNTAMPDELQYPPGEGAPQWILEVPMRAKVVAVVTGYPQGRYRPAEAAGV